MIEENPPANCPIGAIKQAGIIQQALPNVVAIRLGCHELSGPYTTQAAFADAIGIPVKTLRNWEQGRRRPTGPALVLLRLIERDPTLVLVIREKIALKSRSSLIAPAA